MGGPCNTGPGNCVGLDQVWGERVVCGRSGPRLILTDLWGYGRWFGVGVQETCRNRDGPCVRVGYTDRLRRDRKFWGSVGDSVVPEGGGGGACRDKGGSVLRSYR